MSTRRILISPARIAVSRPSYDVVSPPAITTDYLSVDSSFGKPLRLITSGVIYGVSIASFPTIPYGTSFSSYPFVYILPFDSGNPSVIHNLFQKWIHATQDLYFNPYNIKMSKSSFFIGRADGAQGAFDNTYYNTVRNWIYFVFPSI